MPSSTLPIQVGPVALPLRPHDHELGLRSSGLDLFPRLQKEIEALSRLVPAQEGDLLRLTTGFDTQGGDIEPVGDDSDLETIREDFRRGTD